MASKYNLAVLLACMCGLYTAVVSAQPPTVAVPPEEDTLFFLQNIAPLPAFGAQIDIIRTDGSVAGPVVTGKPYSARSITESTQTLADGNRIVQRNESTIYRDSAGRTRREQTLGGVGPWQAGEPVTMINIHDPVANRTYMLEPNGRIAREIQPFRMAIAHAEQAEAAKAGVEPARTEVRAIWSAAAPAPMIGAARGVTVIRRTDTTEDVQMFSGAAGIPADIHVGVGAHEPAEDLGEQVLEGLLVQGTRMKDTIPAGMMGNERPIEIVTDRWYSKDIDAMVLQRFSDPRVGETVYQLVNVVLGEPSPDLFQVPQDYTMAVDEGVRTGIRGVPGQRFEFELRREPGSPPPQ